jgi:hypothetical protein
VVTYVKQPGAIPLILNPMNDLDLELVNMYIQMKRSGHGRAALEHKIICKDKGHYSAVSKMNQYDDGIED